MSGSHRVRIAGAVVAALLLVALVASCAVFTAQPKSPQLSHMAYRPAATATTSMQYTPAPGITVTVSVSPTQSTAPSSSSTSHSTTTPPTSADVTYITPPRYPTPVPTSSGSSGGSGGASPTATPTTGGSGGSATPTPASPTATPTPGPVLVDDATLLSQTPTTVTANASWIAVTATLLNTGSSTWDSTKGYGFRCVQTCWNETFSTTTSFNVPPGSSLTFTGYMSPDPYYYYTVNNSIWQLYDPSNPAGAFGQQVNYTVISHGWSLDFAEGSPSCAGDGSQWLQQGTSGTVACDANSLVMSDGGANGISLDLQSTPASYDPKNFIARVHVHFNTTSALTFAGILVTEPVPPQNIRWVFMVSPSGVVCPDVYIQQNCMGLASTEPHVAPSSDYDLSVTINRNGMGISESVSPGDFNQGGGIYAGGLTGLIEATDTGSTDAAYFSNYQLYQWK